MENLDMFSNWNKMFENINRIANPISTNLDWIMKMNNINQPNIAVIEFMRKIQINNSNQYLFYNDIIKNANWITNSPVKLIIDDVNKSVGQNIYTKIFDKIYPSNSWSNIVKLALLDEIQDAIIEDDLVNVISDISNNIDVINYNLENIDKNPIEFFNNICVSIKSYMDNNPSIKYSSIFIFWLISTIIIPILINNLQSNEEGKANDNQTSKSFNVTNNYYTNSIIAKINIESVSLKNYPRDKSKTVCIFKINDKVRILKDSLKWALVIKENSIESGWIRKENLDFINRPNSN
ncbi:hypothetical protein V3468_04975 [Flavobacterium oreochromis]|uniref:hypothetical protein n=1 Tax=Flavobacterium oreochromis TaxID=2906078 RepID=UPI00385A5D34